MLFCPNPVTKSVPVTLYIRQNRFRASLFLVRYKAAATGRARQSTLSNRQFNMKVVAILATFFATLAAVAGKDKRKRKIKF